MQPIDIISMRFFSLATHYGRIAPNKSQIMLPLALMAALYWLSSLPGMPLPDDSVLFSIFYWMSPSMQNILHIPAYAILAWSWHWALAAWVRTLRMQSIFAGVISSLYGVGDEWHQSFVPGRFVSLADVLLDFTGAALGIWCAVRVYRHLAGGPEVARATNQRR